MMPPVLMAYDTRTTLGEGAVLCESRTLLMERLADPAASPEAQRLSLQRILGMGPLDHKQRAWRQLVLTGLGLATEDLLFGQLQARLPIGPVGFGLDRLTGLLFIPGATVESYARRWAVRILRATPFPEQSAHLERIARVFGWRPADWQDDSDWARACPRDWPEIVRATQTRLAQGSSSEATSLPEWRDTPVAQAPGAVHFLPAYPWEVTTPDLALEAEGPAHRHAGDSRSEPGRPGRDARKPETDGAAGRRPGGEISGNKAADARLSPTTVTGQVFVFVLQGRTKERQAARAWLQAGLAAHGLGSNLADRSGGFDTSAALQTAWQNRLRLVQETERRRLEQEHDQLELVRRAAAAEQAEAERQQALAQLSPEEHDDYRIAQLNDVQFWNKLHEFVRNSSTTEQSALVRALRGPRRAFWEELKQKAKRGHWAQIEQAIRTTCKQDNLGKMP